MLTKKTINQYYYTDRATQVEFNTSLDIHHISHSNYKLSIEPILAEIAIEPRYVNENLIELSVICVGLKIHHNFKYRIAFSEKFGKHDENNQVLGEPELFITLNISYK